MRYYLLILFAGTVLSACNHAQTAKDAGSLKSLTGMKFSDSLRLSELEGWTFESGSVLSNLNAPKMLIADVYSKGNTQIVFVSVQEDSVKNEFRILDLVEVKEMAPGRILKLGSCTLNNNEDPMIVALVKWDPEKEFLSAEKAWHFDRDKETFISIPAENIACMNEVD